MTKTFIRIASAALALAPALASAPAAAVGPTDRNATATARIVKPLKLEWAQDLNLGTILMSGAGSWSGATIAISRTGAFTCTNTNVTCEGATTARVAKYKVTGTNNQTVTITAPNLMLTNTNDLTKSLLLTVDNPGTFALGNSGSSGIEFALGGSITIGSTTTDGLYIGTMNVTVDY